ncbi:MAG TPA: YfiR family protein, partial [Candidatus Polarisedimenticolia bacterium]|nr:YfiR family protein [Candidatus Polarisedimenticolia bacterium]
MVPARPEHRRRSSCDPPRRVDRPPEAGRRFVVLLVAALAACGPAALGQEAPPPFEYQVKAAFVYTVTKFVDWPPGRFADAAAPMVFCVLEDDPFGAALEQTVAGKRVGGRSLELRRLASLDGLGACHVLFL